MTFPSTRRKPESNNGTPVTRGHAGRPKFHSGSWPFFDYSPPALRLSKHQPRGGLETSFQKQVRLREKPLHPQPRCADQALICVRLPKKSMGLPPHTPPPASGSSASAQNAKSAWPPSIHHRQPTWLVAISGAAHPPSASAEDTGEPPGSASLPLPSRRSSSISSAAFTSHAIRAVGIVRARACAVTS